MERFIIHNACYSKVFTTKTNYKTISLEVIITNPMNSKQIFRHRQTESRLEVPLKTIKSYVYIRKHYHIRFFTLKWDLFIPPFLFDSDEFN